MTADTRVFPIPLPRPWLAIVGLGAALAACRAPDAEARSADDSASRPATPVTVTTVTSDDRPMPLVVAVTLAGKEEIPLAFKVGGVLSRVSVESGERVREGQVLAELSDDEIAAAVRKAREGREKAERDLARATALFADSAVTRAQLEDATTGLEVARADERAALFNRRFATITAPVAGVVIRRSGEPGEHVPPGQPIVVVRSARRGLVARLSLSDDERLRVSVGDRATVRLEVDPTRMFEGTVRLLSVAPSPLTGAYEAEIALPSLGDLPSGLMGTASIRPTARRDRTAWPMVPVEALVEADGDSAAVFVVGEGDIARRHAVRIGAMYEGRVPVRRGVGVGDRVVIAGGAYLVDGMRVKATPAPDAERAP